MRIIIKSFKKSAYNNVLFLNLLNNDLLRIIKNKKICNFISITKMSKQQSLHKWRYRNYVIRNKLNQHLKNLIDINSCFDVSMIKFMMENNKTLLFKIYCLLCCCGLNKNCFSGLKLKTRKKKIHEFTSFSSNEDHTLVVIKFGTIKKKIQIKWLSLNFWPETGIKFNTNFGTLRPILYFRNDVWKRIQFYFVKMCCESA